MGFLKKYPLLLLLLLSGGGLTLTGLIGRGSVYQEAEWSGKEPALYLVLDGINRGISPGQAWTSFSPGEMAMDISLFFGSIFRNEEELALFQKEEGTGGEDGDHGEGLLAQEWQKQESDAADNGRKTDSGQESIEQENGAKEAATEGDRPAESIRESGDSGQTEALDASIEEEYAEGADDSNETAGQEERMPLRSFTTVTEDYFSDAVFIGDSRTVGLYEYGGLEEQADFLAKVSLTIYDVQKEAFIKAEGGEKRTVTEMLQKKKYGKVYLMLGINELGTGTVETFMEKYREVVGEIRKLQPEAVIFLQGIMRVTGTKDEADPIFNNTNINIRNEEIAKLADGRGIFYLDVNPIVCDEAGHLNPEYTVDDIHLKARYYELWKNFLLEHGIL